MKFKKAIQELKGYIRDYAEEMLTKSKSKNQYECIFCGSGTGSNGTGALTIYENSFYCFSCRKSGDIFDLIQQAEGIPKNEVVQYAADKYGINLDNSAEREENADYTSFYRECNKHLQDTDIPTTTGEFLLIRLIVSLLVMLHNGSTQNHRNHSRHQD